MVPKPREVYLVPFPFADASAAKQRPAMIISKEKYAQESGLSIVCSLSTNETLPFTLKITDADLEFGNLYGHSSSVLYGTLFTVDNRHLGKRILKLNAKAYTAVIEKLKELLG
jgi:mRNA-degrading endonuclease toxin of MazEF toxin-antitoxin module